MDIRKMIDIVESSDISPEDLAYLNHQVIKIKSPGKIIRAKAEKAMDNVGVDYSNTAGFSWVDTGKTQTRLKYWFMGNRVTDKQIAQLKDEFALQVGNEYKRTDVYRLVKNGHRPTNSLCFRIYFW